MTAACPNFYRADPHNIGTRCNVQILETLVGEKAEQEAFQESEVAKRVSIEGGVAGKMAKHHQTRAKQRTDARQELHEKAQAQVDWCIICTTIGRRYLNSESCTV